MDRTTTINSSTVQRKTVNEKTFLGISTTDTDRHIITKSRNWNVEKSFPKNIERSNVPQPFQAHRFQNLNNFTIGYLNVKSLRNKIEAIEELIQNKIFFPRVKLDETI